MRDLKDQDQFSFHTKAWKTQSAYHMCLDASPSEMASFSRPRWRNFGRRATAPSTSFRSPSDSTARATRGAPSRGLPRPRGGRRGRGRGGRGGRRSGGYGSVKGTNQWAINRNLISKTALNNIKNRLHKDFKYEVRREEPYQRALYRKVQEHIRKNPGYNRQRDEKN